MLSILVSSRPILSYAPPRHRRFRGVLAMLRSVCLSVYLSIYILSIYLSVYLSHAGKTKKVGAYVFGTWLLWNTYRNKMLSYRRETALQGAL